MCRDAIASQTLPDDIQGIGGVAFDRFSEPLTSSRPLGDARYRRRGLS